MAEYLIQDTTLTGIGDAVRTKTGGTALIPVSELANTILSIPEGVELNFEVVGGTTPPTNPVENTIWVNTDTEITGWAFSTTQPESVTEGNVWIPVGTTSSVEFNALKNNDLHIYPLGAMQYVNGEFVEKTSYAYQNGVWSNFYYWDGELYVNGNEYTHITGGWELIIGTSNNVAVAERNESDIFLGQNTNSTAAYNVYARTKNYYDLSEYNSLQVHCKEIQCSYYMSCGISVAVYNESGTEVASLSLNCNSLPDSSRNVVTDHTLTLDISGVTEDCTVVIQAYSSTTSNRTVYIKFDSVRCYR